MVPENDGTAGQGGARGAGWETKSIMGPRFTQAAYRVVSRREDPAEHPSPPGPADRDRIRTNKVREFPLPGAAESSVAATG